MKRTERTVNVKAWGCLGAKRVVLYEDRDELRFTDGFHDMRMTQVQKLTDYQQRRNTYRKK